jgi:UDP:flavonoid glycosyltransferase YjiC (YdhE family)
VRVLYTCLPGHGHFNPVLAMAQATARAGHEVAFATAAEFCPRIEAVGFATFPAGISLPDQLDEARHRFPEQAALTGRDRFEQFVPRMLAAVAAPPRAADLVPVMESWGPDLVVHDETELAGPIAAAHAGLPWADHSVGILRPLAMGRLAGETLAPLCRQWDVDVGPFAGLFRWLYLDVCPPSLQTPEITSVEVAHPVQNVAVSPPGDEPLPPWIAQLGRAPTVYVSLGTIFNQDLSLFEAILEGLGDEAVEVIMTLGSDNDPAALGPQPPNVHVERYVSQSLLLPHSDVVVNQGGTALLEILAHGLPILVIPLGANQFHNADACVAAGVGRRLLAGEVTPESVRAGVRALLDDPAYRERAMKVAAEIDAMPAPADGVRLLERLAAERRPLERPSPQERPISPETVV